MQVSLGDNARQFWDSSDSSTLHLSHSSALPTAAQVSTSASNQFKPSAPAQCPVYTAQCTP